MISLIVPLYNVEPWLLAFMASIAAQTMTDYEVVVVDDCSTDASLAIVQAWAATDPRIKVTARAQNGGPALTRAQAVDLAQGNWLAFVDPDDELAPNRLERMLAAATELDVDWLADDQWIQQDGDRVPLGRLLRDERPGAQHVRLPHLISHDMPGAIGYGTLKPLIRRAFLDHSGVRYPTAMNRCDDFLFQVACGTGGARMALLNEPLYRYRIRRGSEVTGISATTTMDRLREASELAAAMAVAAEDPIVLTALRVRARAIEHHAAYCQMAAHLRAGRPMEAVWALLRSPAAWPHELRHLLGAGLRRLRGIDAVHGNLGA